MFDEIHAFRSKLAAGQRCLGAGISFSDPAVTEALGPSVDFVWIDLEHSTIGPEALLGHLIAARAAGVAALVRVAASGAARLKPVLDAGAGGIIVPQVGSAAEVREVVVDCRYPPLGRRGYGPRRPSDYGRKGGEDYLHWANESLFVSVQIENVGALAEIDDIVTIPGLDSVVLGPADLSASMGRPLKFDDPDLLAAIRRVVARGHAAGLSVGMGMGPSAAQARQAFGLGVDWIQCGGDFSYMVAHVDVLYELIRDQP
jgi:2-keto-3-deoxy-L-rhamnonate aldolase RhmA